MTRGPHRRYGRRWSAWREAWDDSWRHVRLMDREQGLIWRGKLDERASACLAARQLGEEEDVHAEFKIGRVARRSTRIAVRALRRRGWATAYLQDVARTWGPDELVRLAAVVLRGERGREAACTPA